MKYSKLFLLLSYSAGFAVYADDNSYAQYQTIARSRHENFIDLINSDKPVNFDSFNDHESDYIEVLKFLIDALRKPENADIKDCYNKKFESLVKEVDGNLSPEEIRTLRESLKDCNTRVDNFNRMVEAHYCEQIRKKNEVTVATMRNDGETVADFNARLPKRVD